MRSIKSKFSVGDVVVVFLIEAFRDVDSFIKPSFIFTSSTGSRHIPADAKDVFLLRAIITTNSIAKLGVTRKNS